MAITVTGQVNTVMAFSMPSVTTKLSSAPTQVSTGKFPVMFVRNVRVENMERTLSFASGSLNTINFEIVVLVEAARQGNQDDVYTLSRSIMDEMVAELEENASALQLDSYNVIETFESAGDTAYFAVLAEVRTSGGL